MQLEGVSDVRTHARSHRRQQPLAPRLPRAPHDHDRTRRSTHQRCLRLHLDAHQDGPGTLPGRRRGRLGLRETRFPHAGPRAVQGQPSSHRPGTQGPVPHGERTPRCAWGTPGRDRGLGGGRHLGHDSRGRPQEGLARAPRHRGPRCSATDRRRCRGRLHEEGDKRHQDLRCGRGRGEVRCASRADSGLPRLEGRHLRQHTRGQRRGGEDRCEVDRGVRLARRGARGRCRDGRQVGREPQGAR